jgi:type VI secretion system protein ImpE
MNAKQLFDAGNLAGAVEAAMQEVRAKPLDAVARTFMFELFCFAGEWDRAQKQLDVVAHQNAQAEWAATVYGNLLEAERVRARCYASGAAPEFLLDPPEHVRLHVDALGRLAAGKPAEAAERVGRASEMRPAVAAVVNDEPIEEFRDCDDLLAPVLELMIVRDYVWLPLEQLQSLEVQAPERPRDLLWAPARLTLVDGTSRSGYLPVLYFGSHRSGNDQIRLGRLTEWEPKADGLTLGLGRREFLTDANTVDQLSIRSLGRNLTMT